MGPGGARAAAGIRHLPRDFPRHHAGKTGDRRDEFTADFRDAVQSDDAADGPAAGAGTVGHHRRIEEIP